MTDNIRLLRRLEEDGRRRLRGLLLVGGYNRARLNLDLKLQNIPMLSVRLFQRQVVNWRHVFRNLYPAQYAARLKQEGDGGGAVTYQTRIVFRGLKEDVPVEG